MTTGYTVALNAAVPNQLWGVGGTVSFSVAPASGTQLLIQRTLPLTQQTSIQNQGNVYPQVIETAMDTLCMEIQQVSAKTGQFRGTWATGVAYNFGDIVQDGSNGANTLNYYTCSIANTSGTWATDLAAGDWQISFNTQLVSGYATSAAASATTATTEAGLASGSATSSATSAANAASSATSAAASATQAATAASSLVIGTSTTSNTIGTGSKTFTTQSGLALVTGGWVQITDQANGSNFMYGQITSYSTTTLIVNVTATGGSGTKTAWNITLAPPVLAGGTIGQIQYNNAGVLGGVSAVSVANGGTGDIGLTPYAVMCGGATSTGAVASIASVGASGQVLTSNGAGALPTFQGGSSGLTLLATSNASGASSVVFSSTNITNAYNKYQIEFDSLFTSASADIIITISENNGGAYASTSYLYGGQYQQLNGTTITGVSAVSANNIVMTLGIGTGNFSNHLSEGTIKFSNPSQTTGPKTFIWQMGNNTQNNGVGSYLINGEGFYYGDNGAINNIKIAPVSGTMNGNIHLYGIQGT